MKRTFLFAATLTAILSGSPSLALDLVDRVVAELKAQGYSDISVERTLLGRTRITANSKTFDREIVLDPRTGEVLRDYWQVVAGSGATSADAPLIGNPGNSSSGNSGPGGSGSSGSGSSGSGSGSSGSGGSGSGGSGSGGSGSGSGSGGSGHGSGSSGGSGHGSSGGGSNDDDDD